MRLTDVTSANLLILPDTGTELEPDKKVRVTKWKVKQVYQVSGELFIAIEQGSQVEFIDMPQSLLLELIQGE